MFVANAFRNWITNDDVTGFIKLRNVKCKRKYRKDLDWIGIQAMQHQAGFNVEFQNELNQLCRKYIKDKGFWLV